MAKLIDEQTLAYFYQEIMKQVDKKIAKAMAHAEPANSEEDNK